MRRLIPILSLWLLLPLTACAPVNYLRDEMPVNPDLTIHVVIENPAMSLAPLGLQAPSRHLATSRVI